MTSHIEDRDIDAANVTDQVHRFLAAGRLLALEAILQRPAHADPDDRVTVDDKALGTLAQDCSDIGVRAMAPSSALEPVVPILTQPGPSGAVEVIQ